MWGYPQGYDLRELFLLDLLQQGLPTQPSWTRQYVWEHGGWIIPLREPWFTGLSIGGLPRNPPGDVAGLIEHAPAWTVPVYDAILWGVNQAPY